MARFEMTETSAADIASVNTPEVLFELGLIYATGRDGEEDMVAAHKWFNIAAFQGCMRSKARREEIAFDMTKSQIASAQRAAREWLTQL
jgi:TPR repeat protein